MAIIDPTYLIDDHTRPISRGKGSHDRHRARHPTQEIAMIIHRTILAAAFASATGAAHADGLPPLEARSIDLGEVSGVAYYIVERDGFRIVAILAQGASGTPVRFETVLAPGQSVVLSTPRDEGVVGQAIEISRRDDQVLVHEPTVTN
jgi:hypothetical protein